MVGHETPNLLGGHVAHRAEDRAGAGVGEGLDVGARRFLPGPAQLGDPEVEDLDHTVLGEKDVLRLEVAVDDPLLVGGGQATGDLDRELHRLAHAQGARGHAVAQRLALEQLGDDVGRPLLEPSVDLAGVVDGDDVRVVEDAYGAGLLLEAADPVGVRGDLAVQDLEGDLAGEAQVLGPVHLAHAALAEEGHDLVGSHARAGCETRRVHLISPWTTGTGRSWHARSCRRTPPRRG